MSLIKTLRECEDHNSPQMLFALTLIVPIFTL